MIVRPRLHGLRLRFALARALRHPLRGSAAAADLPLDAMGRVLETSLPESPGERDWPPQQQPGGHVLA
ncbi:MAG: hypothetical protein QM586_01125 [Xenophilus sp.]